MVYTLEKASVLVVEDLKPMLDITKSVLTTFGFQDVFGARNAEEGFELLRCHNPDIVITDWLMEPTDGIEFIQNIRTNENSPNPYVPVILMTGYSDRARVEIARDSGITEFLVKPYTAKDLYSRIVQIIEKPRQFVDTGTFFGPDRRRRKNFEYSGPMRRSCDDDDENSEETKEKRKIASQILKDLRESTDKIK